MRDGGLCGLRGVENDVGDAAVCVEGAIQGEVDGGYGTVGGEDFEEVRFCYIFREFFNDDLDETVSSDFHVLYLFLSCGRKRVV